MADSVARSQQASPNRELTLPTLLGSGWVDAVNGRNVLHADGSTGRMPETP